MKGFMRQRDASWELRVYLGPDPLTGKKRYATRTVRGGKREAQSALAEMITEAERGLTARTTATVGELLDAWFEFAAPDFSPKTVKETRGYIDRSLMPTLGSKRLAKLKPGGSRRVLPKAVGLGRFGWSTVGAGHGAAHPRHLAASAESRRQVGMDRDQPGDGDHAATGTGIRHQAAFVGGAGACASEGS